MYYKEDLINGVWSYQTVPDGEWIAFTLEDLSKKYATLKREQLIFMP